MESRREFLQKTSTLILTSTASLNPAWGSPQPGVPGELPWYRRTYRWGQTNLNEKDPERYDTDWWRKYWKKTGVQGLVINAGGIVAYYPSRFPFHHRALFLGDRDLFGELVHAAHEDGIAVLARMDSNRTHEELYRAHPDWFAVDAQGEPYRAADLFVTCIHSPYYDQYIPELIREIASRYHPEGFTDNSWSGLDRDRICYCRYCGQRFRDYAGLGLPRSKDWDDPVYRKWIEWNYKRRLDVWDLNNRTSREAGGPDCLWIGMIGGDLVSEGARFRDAREICRRSELVMFDDQGRRDSIGFQANGEMGKRMHGLLGWEKIIPESMATYQRSPTFRKAANTEAETRMWMLEGFAGTIQPWWHHVGAYQEDRRQFRIVEPIYRWYRENQKYLVGRLPVATVGVVWSQTNTDFYGREKGWDLTVSPYYGVNQALIRARIPYLPIHADHIERDSTHLKALILPNVGAMSDNQLAAVRRFAQAGGGIVASGETSLYDEWGVKRSDFALASLFGIQFKGGEQDPSDLSRTDHSYLRLLPAVGTDVDGPRSGREPEQSAPRHPVLKGFEETNILAFGGRLVEVQAESGREVPMTLIPSFPIYPPETSWMREPETGIPALVLGEQESGGRVAYLAADLDRTFDQHYLPDHGDLIVNLVRWTCRDNIPLRVKGRGLIDCHLYRQDERWILHLVNLTSAGAWRSPVHELIPVGPLTVTVEFPGGFRPSRVSLLVAEGAPAAVELQEDRATFELVSLLDHEVAVFE